MNDLNHIALNPFLVAGLYHDSIVDLELASTGTVRAEKRESQPTKEGWASLGENKKNILFIIEEEGASVLPEKLLPFLTGILAACQLDLRDIAVFNHRQYPDANYKELMALFKPKIIFLAGIDPSGIGLPINFPQFQIQPFSNASFLYLPSLNELEKDKILKSRFWVCLRRLFNL